MALIFVNQATSLALQATTGTRAAAAWVLRLYSNNHVLAHTDTEADLTEVSGGGYAAKPLTAASWAATPGDPSRISYPAQSFEFADVIDGSGRVYGYYVTEAGENGKLIFAEALDGPVTISPGFTVNVTLTVTEASAT